MFYPSEPTSPTSNCSRIVIYITIIPRKASIITISILGKPGGRFVVFINIHERYLRRGEGLSWTVGGLLLRPCASQQIAGLGRAGNGSGLFAEARARACACALTQTHRHTACTLPAVARPLNRILKEFLLRSFVCRRRTNQIVAGGRVLVLDFLP